jgi:hypothetical protein
MIYYHLDIAGGWNYVMHKLDRSISHFERIFSDGDDQQQDREIIIDTFLDKTFLWNERTKDLVYEDAWIGVIHHPPNVPNSCYELLLNENLRNSLKTCLGLIVLSDYLSDCIKSFVLNHADVFPRFPIVHVLRHPIALHLPPSLRGQFRKKILIHVGQHARDYENFYRISCPLFNKYFLTNDYFLPFHVCENQDNLNDRPTLRSRLSNWISTRRLDTLRAAENWYFYSSFSFFLRIPFHPLPNPPTPPNPFPFRRPLQNVDDYGNLIFPRHCKHQKCRALRRVRTTEYIQILRESIVYIHLIDASAVNTVLECVVTGTPLIVNRHPAIVEILTPNYPLYADDVVQAEELLASGNMEVFHRASAFMKSINLDEYRWDSFFIGVQRILAESVWKENMKTVHDDILLMPPCDLLPKGGFSYVEAMEHFESVRSDDVVG